MAQAAQQLNEVTEVIANINDLPLLDGVCALVADRHIAVVKISDSEIYALDNIDPFSQASVISRGIVGDLKGHTVIASPIYKQHFVLATGQCLEDESVSLTTYPVTIYDNGDVAITVGD